MNLTFRPLSDRSWLRPAGRRSASRFRSTWTETKRLLAVEIGHLSGTDLVIGVDVTELDLTLAGQPRTRANFVSPGVEVAFESKHGPLLYRCDEFTTSYYDQGPGWQHNVRAIALTLQALRAVDRYGSSRSGEQYRGYRQIADAPAAMSRADALFVVVDLAGAQMGPQVEDELAVLWKLARRNVHPDRHGGARGEWDRLENAGKALDLL